MSMIASNGNGNNIKQLMMVKNLKLLLAISRKLVKCTKHPIQRLQRRKYLLLGTEQVRITHVCKNTNTINDWLTS